MPSTRKILSEQVLRRLSGGDRSVASRWNPLEIEKAIEQVINSLLRPQHFSALQAGENVPDGCVQATYENVPVTSWKGVSKAKLPAIPVPILKDMGVFRVSASADALADEFIPLGKGMFNYVVKQKLMSDLMGQIGYEVRGGEIIFTKDLPHLSPAIPTVDLVLVVFDMSKYGDFDILPIDANMEAEVIETVVKMFSGTPVTPNVVDPTSDSK